MTGRRVGPARAAAENWLEETPSTAELLEVRAELGEAKFRDAVRFHDRAHQAQVDQARRDQWTDVPLFDENEGVGR